VATSFPTSGLVRLCSILGPNGPIPVSRSTWWAGVKSGRFPQPIKLGPRTTAWRVEDIYALITAGDLTNRVKSNSMDMPRSAAVDPTSDTDALATNGTGVCSAVPAESKRRLARKIPP